MTVTGKTVTENLRDVPSLTELGEQDVVFPIASPLAQPNNHISVLKGQSGAGELCAQAERQDIGAG
jgi:dihydroxy-acid dehydratase